jgi:hypothetical protein
MTTKLEKHTELIKLVTSEIKPTKPQLRLVEVSPVEISKQDNG